MDALVGCLLLDVVKCHIIVVSNVVVVVIVGVSVIVFKCCHEHILNSLSYHVQQHIYYTFLHCMEKHFHEHILNILN